jgi:condensin complex subunit 3
LDQRRRAEVRTGQLAGAVCCGAQTNNSPHSELALNNTTAPTMPGRTATRSTRTARAGAGTKTAGTKTARSSIIEVPDEGPVTSLRTRIAQVFSDASKTTATQRKLVVTLRKIQEECCFEPPETNKGRNEERETFEEDDFIAEMGRVVLRVMNVKKSEPAGDRIVRFLTTFLKYATEKDAKLIEDLPHEDATPSSRLSEYIIKTVLRLIQSKDKTVRYRATQTITQLLNNLEAIDEDIFSLIISSLTKRLRDKEASVRVQAVMGLGRLATDEEDEDEDSDDEASTILEKLVDIMQNDPDAQVRRTILANIPFFKDTIRAQLERARDTDPATRRLVYSRILTVLGDFRHLSLVEREKMIRWGLKDRDDTVRKATAELFSERWIEMCASSRDTRPEEEKVAGSAAPPSLEALCELLERLDIVRAGQEEGMAHEAMRQFWARRPDYIEAIEFNQQFWLELDPSSAFVARSLNDYAQSIDNEQMRQEIEDKIPEPHNFGFILQKKLNEVAAIIDKFAMLDEDDPEAADAQEEWEDAEFVAEQLLHIAMSLDFSDEVGRRNVYSITRTAIALASLPEECTKLCVELLRIVCGNRGEADFCAVIMEAVNEVHDTLSDDPNDASGAGDDAESFHSAQSEHSSPPPASRRSKSAKTAEQEEADKAAETMVYSKCLHILQCTLQNVTCDLESDTNLTTALNTLIIPAVQSHDAMIRERGVICLGLASLLSKVCIKPIHPFVC